MGGKKRLTRRDPTDDLRREQLRAGALAAMQKEQTGQKLSQVDFANLRKWREQERLDQFLAFAHACPQEYVVDLFDSSKKMLQEYAAKGMPRNHDRKKSYDLFQIGPWLAEHWMKIGKGGDSNRTGKDARARRDSAKAELAELELLTKLGTLVYAADVAAEVNKMVTRVRQELLALPSKVAMKLEYRRADEARVVVESAIRDVLSGLQASVPVQKPVTEGNGANQEIQPQRETT